MTTKAELEKFRSGLESLGAQLTKDQLTLNGLDEGSILRVVGLRMEEVDYAKGPRMSAIYVLEETNAKGEHKEIKSATDASLEGAAKIIEAIGSGPYPEPVLFVVRHGKTKHGSTSWVEIPTQEDLEAWPQS